MHARIIWRRAEYCRIDVSVAVLHLESAINFGHYFVDMRRTDRQSGRVVSGERLLVASHTVAEPERRFDGQDVPAERRHLFVDGALRTGTERDHRDNGTNTDDDAQHRERRSEEVAPDRRQRDAKCLRNQHERLSALDTRNADATVEEILQVLLCLHEMAGRQYQD
jgi:hypothetical protein